MLDGGSASAAASLSADADALLWTIALGVAAYASGYTSEGYEPHAL